MSAHGHPPRVTERQPWEGGARAGSCAQVPGGSGSLAAAARQLGMFEKDIFDSAPARSAWRSLVVVWLGAGNARLSGRLATGARQPGGWGRRAAAPERRSPPWRPNSTGTSRHPSGSRAQVELVWKAVQVWHAISIFRR